MNDPPSLHRYFYAHNRPTYFVDPTGHASELFMGPDLESEQNAAVRDALVDKHGDTKGNQLADEYEAFKRGLDEDRARGALSTATLGFYGGIERAEQEGRLGSEVSGWRAGVEGMFSSIPGAEPGLNAYAGGSGAGGVAGAVAGDVTGYTDLKDALTNSEMGTYDRVRAGVSGTLKLAGTVLGVRAAWARGRGWWSERVTVTEPSTTASGPPVPAEVPAAQPPPPASQVSAAERATEIHRAVGEATQRRTTIAVTETAEGTRVVTSSERRLRPAQRRMLREGEVEGAGAGHAEPTGMKAARDAGLTPTGTAASRPICPNCAVEMKKDGIQPLSPLKKKRKGA